MKTCNAPITSRSAFCTWRTQHKISSSTAENRGQLQPRASKLWQKKVRRDFWSDRSLIIGGAIATYIVGSIQLFCVRLAEHVNGELGRQVADDYVRITPLQLFQLVANVAQLIGAHAGRVNDCNRHSLLDEPPTANDRDSRQTNIQSKICILALNVELVLEQSGERLVRERISGLIGLLYGADAPPADTLDEVAASGDQIAIAGHDTIEGRIALMRVGRAELCVSLGVRHLQNLQVTGLRAVGRLAALTFQYLAV